MHLTRRFRWFTVASLVIAPIGIGSVVSTVHAGDPLVEKNQMHFDSVLTELSGRDIGALTATQRSNRGTLVRELAAYSRRGVFPHNYDFPGRAVPYFVDRKTGTLCAVGNLLAFTGRRDVVDRVARANNNVWVDQLSADTAFAAWLDANGLTLHEAARIQL
ncbi:MAG TPA: hypothetical protein VK636_00105, partial [Gemmatimonadaceae bacterium]|nr:hypothetical protein [Gemmatimonadaceae bacterium]